MKIIHRKSIIKKLIEVNKYKIDLIYFIQRIFVNAN